MKFALIRRCAPPFPRYRGKAKLDSVIFENLAGLRPKSPPGTGGDVAVRRQRGATEGSRDGLHTTYDKESAYEPRIIALLLRAVLVELY